MASYDWRLDCETMEIRDGYFSKLKLHIELLHEKHDQKIVIFAHSMGSNVWFYFMQWVTHKYDKNWVDRYL